MAPQYVRGCFRSCGHGTVLLAADLLRASPLRPFPKLGDGRAPRAMPATAPLAQPSVTEGVAVVAAAGCASGRTMTDAATSFRTLTPLDQRHQHHSRDRGPKEDAPPAVGAGRRLVARLVVRLLGAGDRITVANWLEPRRWCPVSRLAGRRRNGQLKLGVVDGAGGVGWETKENNGHRPEEHPEGVGPRMRRQKWSMRL